MIKRFYLPDPNTNASLTIKGKDGKEVLAKIHIQIELANGEVYSVIDPPGDTEIPQIVPFTTIPKLK